MLLRFYLTLVLLGLNFSPVNSQNNGTLYVAWSPDGTMIAVTDSDTFVTVLDSISLQPLNVLTGFNNLIDIVWSPDSMKLAIADSDEIKFWSNLYIQNLGTLDWVYTHLENNGERLPFAGITSMTWKPKEGDKLAYVIGGYIMIVDITNRIKINEYTNEYWSNIQQIIWYSPDNLLMANMSREIARVEAVTGSVTNAFYTTSLADGINGSSAIDISPNLEDVVIGYNDGSIHIWRDINTTELVTEKPSLIFDEHNIQEFSDSIYDVDWNPVYDVVATADANGKIFIWNPYTGEIYDSIDLGDEIVVNSIEWSPDGSQLAYSNPSGDLQILPVSEEALS